MAESASTYAGTRTTRGAGARGADHVASTDRRPVALGDRSPALSRRVNELMRRRGQTEPEQIPFSCECLRADCYELIWLTVDAYDEAPCRRGHSFRRVMSTRASSSTGGGWLVDGHSI